ncbi:kinase [Priestia megaterium]|uniref:kinase n=1 Tax=Priestia megaterium TaxID=1404 RepID=UPI0012D8D235|nr:kinase [Priestia megaterium]MUL34264.1 Serine/threonine-protein kinase B [Priestia megaterium]QSX24016.1 kinase [Priestia megaterium]
MKDFSPTINHKHNKVIRKEDLKEYEIIGDGADGIVYQLTSDRCIKFFFKEETQQRELEALRIGQSSPVMPRLYQYGANFIVMEYIKGFSLARYLKKHGQLTKPLVEKILNMLDELKKLGFTRYDAEIRHVLINELGDLKVIDHKRAFTSDQPVPVKLLKGFKKLGLTDEFLKFVKEIRPSVYDEWKKYK